MKNPARKFGISVECFRHYSLRSLACAVGIVFLSSLFLAHAEPAKVKQSLSKFNLEMVQYAPTKNDTLALKGPTHIAFGPQGEEIITDLNNNRFLYRKDATDILKQSPIAVRRHHSVIYNPKDKLYYANDTDNHRLISFANPSDPEITSQTKNILDVPLRRPHDIVIDPDNRWIYALNPNSGHVFRFSAIGKDESMLELGKYLGGYSRSLSFVDNRLYVIGSAAGRVVEVLDWDKAQVKVHNSYKKLRNAPAGSWSKTGLVLNDVEFYNGFWYASSYFTKSYARGTDADENKLIRFKTMSDLTSGKWEDLSEYIPKGLTPYYFTVHDNHLYLAIFAHKGDGKNDAILRFTSLNQ